ncbi:MAG: hypothetical protein Ct9H300mP19_09130 [Dehalococcoidia bacterium]|nr:MAG: hypothetical protein Ct9H300mP19_09130 [Dehalococcoidia bacterium]
MDEVRSRTPFKGLGIQLTGFDEYATIDDKSRRIAQRSFLDLHEKGHVYQLESPTMWDVISKLLWLKPKLRIVRKMVLTMTLNSAF